jgi:hypothetical protein
MVFVATELYQIQRVSLLQAESNLLSPFIISEAVEVKTSSTIRSYFWAFYSMNKQT